jgi:hypothetical protein
MKEETRICQNCKNKFTINQEDFNFYKKIKVPPPTFCPECRFQRRLSWRNERSLYHQNLASSASIENLRQKFRKEIRSNAIRRFANIYQSTNCTGHNIRKSKNSRDCFDIAISAEDSKFAIHSLQLKNNYDVYGNYKDELCYEAVDNDVGMNNLGTITVYSSHGCFYCFTCQASSNLFGCVGLRGKEYCILNKQYTKEQYEELVPKIIKHMNDMPYIDHKGRSYGYGEFFPSELSPFCYNETIAQEYFPLTKEQALEQGYKWKDREPRNYQIDILNKDIPDDIREVKEDIVNKVIECKNKGREETQCTEAFKIIEDELKFYQRMNLPLPRHCPNCRHYQRLKQRNPLKLWHRKCMKPGCPNEFETSYAPERPEIVYCEECYKREIY